MVDLEYPNVPKNYVLVKMLYSGICHTQLNEISGILGKDRFIPHCMGHEGVGEIVNIGPKVRKFKIKDKVVVSWIKKQTKKFYQLFIKKIQKKLIREGVILY